MKGTHSDILVDTSLKFIFGNGLEPDDIFCAPLGLPTYRPACGSAPPGRGEEEGERVREELEEGDERGPSACPPARAGGPGGGSPAGRG